MKNISHLLAGFALFCLANGCATAQPTAPVAPANLPNMATPVKADNLDGGAFAEWEGVEKPISGSRERSPEWVVWSEKNWPGHSGLWFGESKTPGPRHLRIGFKAPVAVGTVLARGGGQLSVLKPDAAYPGALNDDSQWIPAQRLVEGVPSREEVGNDQYALWTLAPNTSTRALRFTHTAQPADNRYGGWLGSIFVMDARLINLAPQGVAAASSNNQKAVRINNGTNDSTWQAWDNDVSDGGF